MSARVGKLVTRGGALDHFVGRRVGLLITVLWTLVVATNRPQSTGSPPVFVRTGKVQITELMRARSLLSVQREASRILLEIFGTLDVKPAPDGTVRFAFQGDVAFLDRLAMWGACSEDEEIQDDPDEDADAGEDDARDLPKARDAGELDHIREASREALAVLNEERCISGSPARIAA